MLQAILLLLIISLSWIFPSSSLAKTGDGMTLIMKASPDAQYISQYYMEGMDLTKQIMKSKKMKTDEFPEIPYAYLKIGDNESFIVGYSFNLYQPRKRLKWLPSIEVKSQLKSSLETLKKHHYGEELPWKDVQKFFPRMGYADVVDLETGMTFSVQRRAGSKHADVQPLTAKDSKIMKQIYGGKWSWRRRAILVKSGGHSIAASMNGMPHGAGAISGNNFPGHFCIHFKDSTTHKRKLPDPGHDYMVLKASGNLTHHLVSGSPEEMITLFTSAIQERDLGAIPFFINQGDQKEGRRFLEKQRQIEGIKIESFRKEQTTSTGLDTEVAAVVRIKLLQEKEIRKNFVFHLVRLGLTERWKLEVGSLNKQFTF
ncbi:MAG TPA: hypothetical protein VJ824_00695 [Bacillota bacterium]|nr:hypothetical protein [Bacillota bacterium]